MKIYIPHLNYTITVKEPKNPPKELYNPKAWVHSEGSKGCTMYITKKPLPSDLAHEVVHVLQFICLNRNIDFTTEQEHMGYLMQYIMGEILGYEWV
jgi:hypothetical protein